MLVLAQKGTITDSTGLVLALDWLIKACLTHWPQGDLNKSFDQFQANFSDWWPRYLLRYCPQINITSDKLTLVQVLPWCYQTTSHYLIQCGPRSMLPYGITRPQWVKDISVSVQGFTTPQATLYWFSAPIQWMGCPSSSKSFRSVVKPWRPDHTQS